MVATVYIGWDPRQVDAFRVCERSLKSHASIELNTQRLALEDLRAAGLYHRPTELREGYLWDCISEAPMSTEFAIARFFVPFLARQNGFDEDWVLFCDCDFLWLEDIKMLLAEADSTKAICCVKHEQAVDERTKMDGQAQQSYARKNWSSLMLINLKHPANDALTPDLINRVPGRDLHRFCWLEDDQIGALSPDWNWLEGSSPERSVPPRAVHFTRGGPWLRGWEHVAYADLWLRYARGVEPK